MRLFAAQDFIATRDRAALNERATTQEHGIALRRWLFPATCDGTHCSPMLVALLLCC